MAKKRDATAAWRILPGESSHQGSGGVRDAVLKLQYKGEPMRLPELEPDAIWRGFLEHGEYADEAARLASAHDRLDTVRQRVDSLERQRDELEGAHDAPDQIEKLESVLRELDVCRRLEDAALRAAERAHEEVRRQLVKFGSDRRQQMFVAAVAERDAALADIPAAIAGPLQRWSDARARMQLMSNTAGVPPSVEEDRIASALGPAPVARKREPEAAPAG